MRKILAGCLALVFALTAGAAVATAEKVVLYTSMPKKAAEKTVADFQGRNPGIEVELFRSGSAKVLNKLQAEFAAGAVQADVVMIADEISMEALKQDGRLQAYPDAPVDGLPNGSYDKDMQYFGTKTMSTVLIYNVNNAAKPKSWADLLGPDNKGQVIMASPVTGGAALAHLSYLLGQGDFGWAFYEKLEANGAQVIRANGAVRDAVADGSKKYGMVLDYVAVAAKKKGSPVDYVYPPEGVVGTYQPVAILKDARNAGTARKLIDYLLSDEGQALVGKLGYRPLSPKVAAPDGFPATDTVKIVPVDGGAVSADRDAIRKKFDELFGG